MLFEECDYNLVGLSGEYKWTLCEEWHQKACDELCEDDVERESTVQALRQWTEQQKWLKTPTGEQKYTFSNAVQLEIHDQKNQHLLYCPFPRI